MYIHVYIHMCVHMWSVCSRVRESVCASSRNAVEPAANAYITRLFRAGSIGRGGRGGPELHEPRRISFSWFAPAFTLVNVAPVKVSHLFLAAASRTDADFPHAERSECPVTAWSIGRLVSLLEDKEGRETEWERGERGRKTAAKQDFATIERTAAW